MQSLDELRRVIRRIETRRPPRPAAPPAHEVLGGELVETGAGPLLIVRREYPLTHIHGRQPLAPAFAAPLHPLSAVARAAAPAPHPRGAPRRPPAAPPGRPRGVFTARGAACRLTPLGRGVRGLEREDAVRGAQPRALYSASPRPGGAAPRARVFDHNRHDVLSLV